MLLSISLIDLYGQGRVSISPTGQESDASAALDVVSPDKGVLIPRMSSVTKMSIPAPGNGVLVYDTDSNCIFFYRQASASWFSLCQIAAGLADPQGPIGLTGATGPQGPAGPVVYATANYIIKSDDTSATCTVAPIFEYATGKVGIGTTTPADKLSVGSACEFRVNTTGDLARIKKRPILMAIFQSRWNNRKLLPKKQWIWNINFG